MWTWSGACCRRLAAVLLYSRRCSTGGTRRWFDAGASDLPHRSSYMRTGSSPCDGQNSADPVTRMGSESAFVKRDGQTGRHRNAATGFPRKLGCQHRLGYRQLGMGGRVGVAAHAKEGTFQYTVLMTPSPSRAKREAEWRRGWGGNCAQLSKIQNVKSLPLMGRSGAWSCSPLEGMSIAVCRTTVRSLARIAYVRAAHAWRVPRRLPGHRSLFPERAPTYNA